MNENPEVKVTQEVTPEQTPQAKATTVEVPTFNSPEEYKKHVQSISSKAKGELLKELGITKLAEGKSLLEKAKGIETLTKEYETLKAQNGELTAKVTTYENNELLAKVGIPKESSEMFFKLVDESTHEGTREQKAFYVKEQLAKLGGQVVVGTTKTPPSNKTEVDKYMESNPRYKQYQRQQAKIKK